ncbi:MAG: hypothetical protein RL662_2492 [Bacteroidota bacterium]|jgi:hypothetical protein
MPKTKFTILYLLLVVTLLACKNSTNKKADPSVENTSPISKQFENRKIANITALYYNYILDSSKVIDATNLTKDTPSFNGSHKGVLDMVLTDSAKINKLDALIKGLQPASPSKEMDTRIQLLINYTDKMQDTLSIGGKYANLIFLNGIEQTPNNELLFRIKNDIGFYPWFIGDDLFQMLELQDNSFIKEPFISTNYYKAYQKALAEK